MLKTLFAFLFLSLSVAYAVDIPQTITGDGVLIPSRPPHNDEGPTCPGGRC